MNNIRYISVLLLLAIIGLLLFAGSCEKKTTDPVFDQNPYYPVMFYNVENLFDTLDQADARDEEFLPDGEKEWNSDKLFNKLNKVARVIEEADTSMMPSVIGLCEVENRLVLEMLVNATSLREHDYEIVHKESPDYRGIDVALLYKPSDFELIDYRLWPVWFPFDTNYSTREVLYVKGNLNGDGVVHFFVNHWPSRSGGEIETRPKRIFVAEMVRSKVDSILTDEEDSRIVIMGDLNDEPNDLSVISGLSAHTNFEDPENNELYAISMEVVRSSSRGSYKYKGNWNVLDQFIVSGFMMDTTGSLYTRNTDVSVVDHSYLLEDDKTYMGKKPYRTFLGDYFHGGYSDHLPVLLKIRHPD